MAVLGVTLLALNFGFAFNFAVANEQSISAPNSVRAIVDLDNHTVNIEDGYIKNDTDHKYQLQEIKLDKQAYTGSDKWTIKNENTILFNDNAGNNAKTALDIVDEVKLSYSTNASFDICKSLVGKTAVIANFKLQKYINITGRVIDRFGNPVADAKVQFEDMDPVVTNNNGEYVLQLLPGSKGKVKLSANDKIAKSFQLEVTKEDAKLDDIMLKSVAHEPNIVKDLVYNKAEQTGVVADDTLEITGNKGTDAGEYTATYKPAENCLWQDESDTKKSASWSIAKANPKADVPEECKVRVNELFEQNIKCDTEAESAEVSFSDPCLELKDKTGTPQDLTIKFVCNETKNNNFTCSLSYPECKNYNAGVITFKVARYINVNGKVVDIEGKPIEGAKVESTYNDVAYTDVDGKYTIQLKPGVPANLSFSKEEKALAKRQFDVPYKDLEIDVVELKNLAKEPEILKPDKVYNGEEQVGIEGDDTIELKAYAAKDAGKHVAIAKPIPGYAWENGDENERSFDWNILQATPTLTIPDYEISNNGVTAAKTILYSGELESTENIKITLSDKNVTVNSISGLPQYLDVSFKCGTTTATEISGTISYPECNNYTAVSKDFKIKIVPGVKATGKISKEKTAEVGHDPSPIVENLNIKFVYADESDNDVTVFTKTNKDGKFTFVGVPQGSKGVLSCNDFGYFGKTEAQLTQAEQSFDIKLEGPNFDNYSLEDLTVASDMISKNDETLKTEFEWYLDHDVIWFSQSNSLQNDDAKKGYFAQADTSLCNHAYKNNFDVDYGKILPEDEDICQYMFLRVIGIKHDNIGNTDGSSVGMKAGLTLQTVCSLPCGYAFQELEERNVSWWGDSNNSLRTASNSDNGKIFSKLAEPYKKAIVLTQKHNQANPKGDLEIKNTGDKLFPLSYTEMCNEANPQYPYDYYKDGAEGNQYRWYQGKNVSGIANNKDLVDLGRANCDTPMGRQVPIAIGRSPYPYSDEMQQYLTINDKGAIYSYNKDFTDKNGYAPAFCVGTMQGAKYISFEGENVTFTDLNDNPISSRYSIEKEFSFKIKPSTGVKITDVIINGQHKGAIDKCTVTLNTDTTVKVLTEGTSQDAPYLTGTANVVKHVGDKIQNIPYQDQKVEVSVDDKSFVTRTDENGKYTIEFNDKSFVGKAATVKFVAHPGVNAYESGPVTLTLGKNTFNPEISGLDYYTFEELSEVGNWLNAHESDANLKDTPLYKEFDSYIVNNCVWYSNSNGLQPDTVLDKDPNKAIEALFNQDYRCFFPDASGNSQFLYLRVMDILHDELASGNGHAGLTFQTVHSVPVKTIFGGKWWGDSSLRTSMQRNGSIFNKISACNMTDYMVSVNKYSQADRGEAPNIKITQDKMFPLSYSEIWAKNGALTQNRSWYGNDGNNTEGFTYKWYKAHDIDGSKSNEIILHMHWNNNNIQVGEKGATWERSVYYDNEAYSLLIREGAPNSWNFDTSGEGVALAFCLGGK